MERLVYICKMDYLIRFKDLILDCVNFIRGHNDDISYKRDRIVRVIVNFRNGMGCGTGFFINNEGIFLTCFHVVFGRLLRDFRTDNAFLACNGSNEHDKLSNYYSQIISSIQVILSDGNVKQASLINFDEKFDVAILKIDDHITTKYFALEFKSAPNYNDSTLFCGFQEAAGYPLNLFPFSINRAVVSSFPEVQVGGEKYEHLQLNSINLGGNSGAPLFYAKSHKVIGIINGNYNKGSDSLASYNNLNVLVKTSLRIPLSIAYATLIKTIKEQTTILNY